ncbi:hypothetical protein EsH8_V_000688 [Colletotrichum jinshuiense]
MRLIDAETLELQEFFENATPDYAILSHTWEVDEVSLQQFQQRDAATTAKAGYQKIRRACSKALDYGLRHIWVDTCCIDKTSSAELSEAINSMFQWYAKSKICFAYLADMPSTEDAHSASFAKSRWFTRGWTLQELLAPHKLDFFSSDWKFITNRAGAASIISNVTGINVVYFRDTGLTTDRKDLLASASIAERMSWAATRTTTRTEDMAYCLLGIFNINMPLIYGEGQRAFMRLQQEVLRSSFDPTLLAWNAISLRPTVGHLLPIEPEPFSSWHQAWKMIAGIDHPWSSSPPSIIDRRSTGFLAPSINYFRHCKDILSCDVAVDWAITSQGLEIVLPVSETRQPYGIIPCRLRADAWSLLAIPLTPHASEGGRYGVWVESFPEELKLLQVFSSLTDGFYGLAALMVEDRETNETFAIIVKIVEELSTLTRAMLPSRGSIFRPQKIEFRFLEAASRDSVERMFQTPSKLASLPKRFRVRQSPVRLGVARKQLLDLPVFEIRVRLPRRGWQSLTTASKDLVSDWVTDQLCQLCTSVLPRVITSRTSLSSYFKNMYEPTVVLAGSLVGILSYVGSLKVRHLLGEHIMAYLEKPECNAGSCRQPDLFGPVKVDAFLAYNLYRGALLAGFLYQLVPLVSCFYPTSSAFFRGNRWIASFLFAAVASPIYEKIFSPVTSVLMFIVSARIWKYQMTVGSTLLENSLVFLAAMSLMLPLPGGSGSYTAEVPV